MVTLAYVCARPQAGAAAGEYASFRAAMRRDDLERIDLVRDGLPADAFDRYAGFVVGGSPFNVTDPRSTKTDVQLRVEGDLERIAERAASAATGALFTCYGIGIVTRMLGGEVSRAYPEDTGPSVIRLTPAAASDRVFGGLAAQFTALTAHKEGSGDVPPGATLLATNDACPVQAYRVGDTLYATQFHPEPTGSAFTERMAVYRDDGYFSANDYDAIAARVVRASLTEPVRLLQQFARAFGA
ncbi:MULTISPECIES: glutamine amidotransferase-related protein [Microbacterium]|uniref:glutamine amidotransferase-related protein n=1 Tax=Microbacterium TaxID=33882 RepID=UPI00214CDB8C|nr:MULTISPECIES: GMP synthase [unclassified Microbacterium]MCR2813800.1 GMP synthase [Microbacterium sp. zg.Y1084]MDL5487534.1 GMP synthase [Microbacterium sp. zg-Y1211]